MSHTFRSLALRLMVLAKTHFLFLLDPALRRPGRLDETTKLLVFVFHLPPNFCKAIRRSLGSVAGVSLSLPLT